MPGARKILLFILLTAIGFAGYLLVKGTNSQVATNSSQAAREAVTQDAVAEPPQQPASTASNGQDIDTVADQPEDAVDCISPAQLEMDALLAEEYARFDSLLTLGPTIESYRGLSSSQVRSLATQGDSAAMAVMGAVSVMRAMKRPEGQAVAYLLLEEPGLRSFSFDQPLAAETARHLEEASDWFYKAAVHGRLLALQNAGEVIAIVGGSPTELGWIPQEEYDMLEPYERHALDPTNVYGALAFEIAPELRSGPMGTMISDLTPGGEQQQLILHELAWQFSQDREAAGLPPIDIPESTAPSMAELESLLCEP